MSYYSFQKGKHGGTAGFIFPFFTALNGLTPDEQYADLIPAGFLKCQGQILPAAQYRALASIIGVGSNCIYKKEGVELDEADDNGEGGQIQLPDLGSKYIAGSINPGIYNNLETSVSNTQRAGIAVELFALGDNIDFFYSGDFKVPSRSLSVTGNIASVSPPSSTPRTTLTQSNYLPHGHTSTFSVARRINTNCRAINSATWRANNYYCSRRGRVCFGDSNFGVKFTIVELTESGTDSGSTHNHTGTLPRITSESKAASMQETLINASSIVTNVKVRTNTQVKMDEFAPKYILCEYLIKY